MSGIARYVVGHCCVSMCMYGGNSGIHECAHLWKSATTFECLALLLSVFSETGNLVFTNLAKRADMHLQKLSFLCLHSSEIIEAYYHAQFWNGCWDSELRFL